MLFGESQYKQPKKTSLQSLKWQLLALVLVLAIGGLLLTHYNLRWGSQPSSTLPSAAEPSASSSPSSSQEFLEPMEPQDPEPFEEKPEVLFRAASLDRTSEVSEEAIAYLFQKIRTDRAAFQTEKPALSLDENDPVWEKLLEDPDMYRGRVVEIKGQLVPMEVGGLPLRLEGMEFPNPSGLDRRFETFLLDTTGKLYRVTTFKKKLELGYQDAVRLRAYFCGLYTNFVEVGGTLRRGTVPFLVGEDFELLARPVVGGGDSTVYLPLILVLPFLAFVVILVLHLRTKRTYERRRAAARVAMEERRAARQAGRRAAGSHAGEQE